MPLINVPFDAAESLQVVIMDDGHSSSHQRELSKELRSGTKRLLAVRITGLEGTEVPDETLPQIRDAIFGSESTGDLPTVVSQYAAVSHGSLQYVPSAGAGISDGVAEISISTSIMNGTSSIQGALMQEILDATALSLGDLESVADQVIFCLPTGSLLNNNNKWTAFTYRYEPYSFYQKSRCTKLSVAMHELGHSHGFRHSGKGSDLYLDEQGYMGYANNKMHGPQKGFNAHKHWISGWFDDRSVDIEENLLLHRAMGAPLVSFVDASNEDLPQSEAVVLKVKHLYVQYNRAKGYNSGTFKDQKDRVTVNYAESEDDVSDLVAELAVNETYVHASFDEAGNDLIIQVCSVGVEALAGIDYAVVSVHLDDGFQTSICGDSSIVSNNWRTVQAHQDTASDFDEQPEQEQNAVPSVAPSFNEDLMAAEDTFAPTAATVVDQHEIVKDEQELPVDDKDVAKESGAVPGATDAEQTPSEADKQQPEVLEEDNPDSDDDEDVISLSEDGGSGPSILMMAIAACSASTLAGLTAWWFCHHRSADMVTSSKSSTEYPSTDKPGKKSGKEITDSSETEDCSDRLHDEDGVIEVKMLHATSSDYIDAEDVMW